MRRCVDLGGGPRPPCCSGVTARTICFYQSVDVLPKPDRRGRAAVYHQKHLERLRLIAELRDRGLTLSAIGHLLGRRVSPGMSVGASGTARSTVAAP
jgi:DNA-binding transcriptional MerR regulator